MTHYSHIPMVRILLPFLAGILLFSTFEYFVSWPLTFSMYAVFIMTALAIGRFWLQSFGFRHVFGLHVMLILLFSGYLLAQTRYQKEDPGHFSNFPQNDSMLRLQVSEPVSEKTNTYQIIGRVTHLTLHDTLFPVNGRLIAWLAKDSLAASLKYGDIIWVKNKFQEVREPQNPHAFNYKQFLARQNIFHQTYLRSGEWHFTGKNHGNILMAQSHKMREKALHILEENHIKGREFSVASALLLGYRDYLDEDLQREFSGAGAMHILCVSGLHVGIIFLALNLAFGFLARLPRGRMIKTIVIIILIWFYAAITGFSPSVMRASTMFSFVALGQTFSRSTNIYNTLAASALVLLILDPFIVLRIGFQLSYIAVISIVFLQPLFYKLIKIKNPVLDKAWGIITVSMAAQLGTGPLSLFYFNQFPNFFLLTNLIVIPLTGVIIKAGLLFYMTSFIPLVGSLAGKALSILVLVLHSSVRWIEGLPGSATTNVYISFPEKWLVLLVVAFLGLFWFARKKAFLFGAMASLLLFAGSVSLRSIFNQRQMQLFVYHVPNASAIDFVYGKSCYFRACNNALQNPRNIDFNLRENRLKTGIAKKEPVILPTRDTVKLQNHIVFLKNNLMQFGEHTFLFWDNQQEVPSSRLYKDTLDFIIVSHNPRISMAELTSAFSGRTIIMDSSNSFWRSQQWLKECDSLGLHCWSVSHQGAFAQNLK